MSTPSQVCPEIGVWRAWLDQEDHSPLLFEHLAMCAGCQHLVDELRDDAASVSALLGSLAPARLPSGDDVAVARHQLTFPHRRGATPSVPEQEPIPMFFKRISTPWRITGSGLAAALALSLLVAFTPQGQSTAAAFLAQFRPQQVAAVEISPQSQTEIIKTLNALGNLGTVKMPGGATRPEAAARTAAEQVKTVSLAEASQSVGFAVETPDKASLPVGMDTTPKVQVMPASQVRFTVDRTKARTYFQSTGHPEVVVPDKFDGATLVVSIPSAVLLQYGNSSSKDALIIGQAGELVVDVEGKVSLDEMRDFLLSLPGLPPSVVNQLRQIKNWNQTLPVPVPIDQVNWKSASFNGHQGLLLNDNSGIGSAALWYDNGHMYGLAGSLKATDLQKIANSLAVRN
jgi:hypothetical protein